MRLSRSLRIPGLCLWLVSLAVGCGLHKPPAPPPAPPRTQAPFTFRDVAAEAGIQFRLGHVGRSPLTVLETACGGCAFLDYDQDGWPDALLVGPQTCRLYRNLGNGRFTDVSSATGLSSAGRWMGCSVADWDGDGYPDLLITGYRCLALYRNRGGKRFEDVTASAGVATNLWTTSADFADVDRDGDLDLYVGAYVAYHVGKQDLCRLGSIRTACGPEQYAPERGRFYRNNGGRFEDQTRAVGLDQASGKTWGVIFADQDGDGWSDLYLGNDMTACNLFRNLGKGPAGTVRFQDEGFPTGTAFDEQGNAMGAMGVDWGDYNGDGMLDLFVGTYFRQAKALFRNEGKNSFQHASQEAGISLVSRPYVSFGGGFFDPDNDGDLDLLMVNGHVRDNIRQFDPLQEYAEPMQLLENRGNGTFRDVTSEVGDSVTRPLVGRGAAFADFDNDGDVDVLVVDLEGGARLLRNESKSERNHWIAFQLAGKGLNREGLGARVTVTAGGKRLLRVVKRGGSVLSAADSRCLVGLGAAPAAERVEIRWADGRIEAWTNLPGDRIHHLSEGSGQAPVTATH